MGPVSSSNRRFAVVEARDGPVCRVAGPAARHTPVNLADVYFTDRGIEELAARRGEEEVSFEWLADQLRTFVDLNPDFETPVERLATWLARLDDDED
ncbi:hypothetical protein GCM10009845_05280 [Pedococcus bigeumensis]